MEVSGKKNFIFFWKCNVRINSSSPFPEERKILIIFWHLYLQNIKKLWNFGEWNLFIKNKNQKKLAFIFIFKFYMLPIRRSCSEAHFITLSLPDLLANNFQGKDPISGASRGPKFQPPDSQKSFFFFFTSKLWYFWSLAN